MTETPPRQKVATRLFVEKDLAAGLSIGLTPEQAHFLRSVLRLAPGALVALFNGRDGEWTARLEGLGKGWASLSVEGQSRDQEEEPDLWLAFAPIKRARIDFLAEKASELGVRRLLPVLTQRTAVERVNVERLAANAREAAEQCERLTVPEVAVPTKLDALLTGWPLERRLLVCAEAGPSRPIAATLRALTEEERAAPWAVIIGPEGGFTPDELERLASHPGALPVGLGPRLLRSDTAALAALACWQALVGSWQRSPREGPVLPARD